jgi:ABC-type nitrate/sulfonate/bicarbonate transport system substrate-binding protein
MFRLSVADLDSPSYFVATAAVELGFFEQQGLKVELVYDTQSVGERLHDGALDFFGGPAYGASLTFPGWKGAKLLCALAQYSYWFLAVRSDLDVQRGDLSALKGLRIAASPTMPGLGLRHLLAEAGIDLARDNVRIVSNPRPAAGEKPAMGRSGIDAIEQGRADAFWGNGMRVALAEKARVAKMHLDLRRGDGPKGALYYNFAALTTTARLVEEQPEVAAGAIRAIVNAQKALQADPSLATQVGRRLFPPDAAALIAGLIARDALFYDAVITPEAVDGLNSFAQANALISEPVQYNDLVATQFRNVWSHGGD